MNDPAPQSDQLKDLLVVDSRVSPEPVEPRHVLGCISLFDRAPMSPWEPDYVLNIAGAHQDHVTRAWATDVTSRAIQLVEKCSVHRAEWEIGELSNPSVFRDAVHAASMADILLVSVRANDTLLLNLYEWIEAWLALRLPLPGVLVALIGVSEKASTDTSSTQRYLGDVAKRGELEFLSQHRELPLELTGPHRATAHNEPRLPALASVGSSALVIGE